MSLPMRQPCCCMVWSKTKRGRSDRPNLNSEPNSFPAHRHTAISETEVILNISHLHQSPGRRKVPWLRLSSSDLSIFLQHKFDCTQFQMLQQMACRHRATELVARASESLLPASPTRSLLVELGASLWRRIVPVLFVDFLDIGKVIQNAVALGLGLYLGPLRKEAVQKHSTTWWASEKRSAHCWSQCGGPHSQQCGYVAMVSAILLQGADLGTHLAKCHQSFSGIIHFLLRPIQLLLITSRSCRLIKLRRHDFKRWSQLRNSSSIILQTTIGVLLIHRLHDFLTIL